MKALNKLYAELEREAYVKDYHTYDYKRANQIIRAHFEKLEATFKQFSDRDEKLIEELQNKIEHLESRK